MCWQWQLERLPAARHDKEQCLVHPLRHSLLPARSSVTVTGPRIYSAAEPMPRPVVESSLCLRHRSSLYKQYVGLRSPRLAGPSLRGPLVCADNCVNQILTFGIMPAYDGSAFSKQCPSRSFTRTSSYGTELRPPRVPYTARICCVFVTPLAAAVLRSVG